MMLLYLLEVVLLVITVQQDQQVQFQVQKEVVFWDLVINVQQEDIA
jgi:hypothetical protein